MSQRINRFQRGAEWGLDHLDDQQFLTTVTDCIEGWCHRIAAHLTMTLLRSQREHDAGGGMLEIGVYKGKYLSILLREATEVGALVAGIDTFQFLDEATLRDILGKFFPRLAETLRIYNGPSTNLSTGDIEKMLGRRPRFVSVDGSHMAPDIEYDLNLAASVTTEAGIVAIDDFINPMTLGVNEGVARFMMAGGGERLSPFCYCTNKLFCCRPQFREIFMRNAEAFIRNHTEYSEAKKFVDLDATWRGAVEVDYFGHKLLTIH